MAHLWVRNEKGEWVVQPLESEMVTLSKNLPDLSHHWEDRDPNARLVGLMRVTGTNTEVWILMAGVNTDVRINGVVAAGGLRVLCDKDEIYFQGRRSYFSAETLADVVPFPGAAPAPFCPRCQQAIEAGTNAVRCPHCAIWHHQSESLPCWTYADTCAVCPQPTDLEAGYRWTPEELGP